MPRDLPGPEAIREILQFLPRLENPDTPLAKSEFGDKPGGISYTVWNSPLLDDFEAALYRLGFIIDFDWPSWEYAAELYANPDLIATADLSTICRLLTTHVRKDRFCGGHLAGVCEEGHIPHVLRRLEELAR